ncbi:DHA1 family tetracycline resistance protein-like MFS transporter [Fluviicoccus keumensis]|uniref:DHA1 family tetracycline resistance protein-like MFS transporter n=1 Tax=Fluviicoccus keumensis TaxID=1435465 RepID=A0A4Q7Z613_9GAMM|nr:TCR/Tet family MFS transporter [Fluviicoccus keumensis]RZU45163.1 DHA1 family tetracycline resistance protein-like MFS transporter [Fluviicoccus keumensis]
MSARQASLRFILFTVFLDVLGIGLMIPVLPTLVGSMAHSPDSQAAWFGALATTYGVMQFLFSPLLGALSDRYGRRPVLLLSMAGLGFSYVVSALTTSLTLLLMSRLVSGATGASFSVANAYVADITPADKRGKAFGAIGAAFGVGFVFGPVVGGMLGSVDLRLPFVVSACLSLANVLYGWLVLPESLPPERRSPLTFKRVNPLGALNHLAELKGVSALVAVFVLSSFAQFILQNTWVLYTEFRFHWKPWQNGLALFVVGMMSAVVQGVLMGKLLRRFGEHRLIMLGLGSSALAYLCYGLITRDLLLYPVILANFLSFAVTPSLQALISRAAAANEQGVVQGSLNGLNSIVIVLAPLVGTTILAKVGHLGSGDWRIGATFFLCSALQLIALAVAARHFRRGQPAN